MSAQHKASSRIQNSHFPSAKDDKMTSMFSNLTLAPPDPILGVTIAFKADTSPNKVDLGVGAYRTDDGKPYVLRCVRKAEERMLAEHQNKEYLPIDGIPEFDKLSAKVLFGSALSGNEKRVVTSQSLSGTGALRLGSEFIKRYMPQGTTVYMSKPTWGNHFAIFKQAGLATSEYRYFDPKTVGLDFAGMTADLQNAPDRSVFVLHVCAHNPTGVDPSQEQWEKIADIIKAKNHLAFLDCAYQGYASGSLERDGFAARLFLNRGLEFMAAQSYSKNFGLYGERAGTFSVVLANEDLAVKALSQIKLDVRPMYSNPPLHGARIVATVLGDKELFDDWVADLKGMADRIIAMRHELRDALKKRGTPLPNGTPGEWKHVTDQIGMFSYTGLTEAQVKKITSKHHIYLLSSGRISMAGINTKNINYIADAIHDVVTNPN